MDEPDKIREVVREHYGKVATQGASVGCSPGCCGAPSPDSAKLGYTPAFAEKTHAKISSITAVTKLAKRWRRPNLC